MKRLAALFAFALVTCAITNAAAVTRGASDDGDPAVVALVRGEHKYCSGALVSRAIVVTAAHCLASGAPDAVYFGDGPSQGRSVRVRAIRMHPSFELASLTSDIGVIDLDEPVDVAPVSMPDRDIGAGLAGGEARIVGFGEDGARASGGRKRTGRAAIARVDDHRLELAPAPSLACSGDSGGPVFATIDGRELLIGITSYGDGECSARTIETRVDVVRDFLAPPPQGDTGCSLARRSTSSFSGAIAIAIVIVIAALTRRRGSPRTS